MSENVMQMKLGKYTYTFFVAAVSIALAVGFGLFPAAPFFPAAAFLGGGGVELAGELDKQKTR